MTPTQLFLYCKWLKKKRVKAEQNDICKKLLKWAETKFNDMKTVQNFIIIYVV